MTPGAGSVLTPGRNLNNFGRGPLDHAIYKKCLVGKTWPECASGLSNLAGVFRYSLI